MTRNERRRLLRLLREPPMGEQEIAERLGDDPEIEKRYRRLLPVWHDLEPPPASEVPPDFAAAVVAAARREAREPLVWSRAPAWARAGAVAALLVGLAAGTLLGGSAPAPALDVAAAPASFLAAPPSLAELYWLGVPELLEDEEEDGR